MVNHPFGWDYPPGVTSLPADEPWFCEVCKSLEAKCICTECTECGAVGDPDCYKYHGMTLTPEQLRRQRNYRE